MRAIVLVVVTLCLGFAGCSSHSPDAGQEVVLVDRPIIFGHGGVRDEPVKTGRKFTWWTTTGHTVDMRPQQFPVHFDDFMSSDGVPLDFDAVIRLQIIKSVSLIQDFGSDWYKLNVEAEFANRVRQAVRKHGMNETAIKTEAIESIDAEVSAEMEKYFVSAKLPVKLIQMTVGKANPPDSIKGQRVETAAQQQRVLTERERKLAEDSRLKAEQSRAAADNAYRQAMQLSPEQFLALETIKMQRDVCAKDGTCTFFIGGNVTPVLDVKK